MYDFPELVGIIHHLKKSIKNILFSISKHLSAKKLDILDSLLHFRKFYNIKIFNCLYLYNNTLTKLPANPPKCIWKKMNFSLSNQATVDAQ